MINDKTNFSALLEEMEALQKSFSAEGEGTGEEDDEKIQAAADGDVDGDGVSDGKDKDTAGAGDADEELMGKSFKVTLESGEEVEALDGTQLVKSLIKRADDAEESMTKAMSVALTTMQAMQTHITKQANMIKSLQADVARIGNEGRGRKAVVSVLDKQIGEGKKGEDGIAPREFMAKALGAQKAGRITGSDVAIIESYVGRGMQVPGHLVTKVMG